MRLIALLVGFSYSVCAANLRGVDPSKLKLYQGPEFECLDKRKRIPISQVNDDYCDCLDGSDEPGTSACPTGVFYCTNKGHLSAIIPASRVNDGICELECCDGSDEYLEMHVKCPNRCNEAAEEYRVRQELLTRVKAEGARKKREYIDFGRRAKQNRDEEIRKLNGKLSGLETDVARLETLKEEAKRQENRLSGLVLQGSADTCHRKLGHTKHFLESLKARLDAVAERIHELEDIEESDAESLKRKIHELRQSWDSLDTHSLNSLPLLLDETVSSDVSEYDSAPPESDSSNEQTWTGMLAEIFDRCARPVFFIAQNLAQGKIALSDLDSAKQEYSRAVKDYDTAVSERDSVKNQLSSLQSKSSLNYGPDEVLAKLDDQCFDYRTPEYTYEICPFKEAKQKSSSSGHVIASLGSWESLADDITEISTFKFINGAQCWNGPQRSLLVRLSCGEDNEILAVTEPNKCEYEMEMKSPIACALDA